jgi:hypothetical protein
MCAEQRRRKERISSVETTKVGKLVEFECTYFTDALFVILYTSLTFMFIYWSRKSIIAKLQIIGLTISHSTARQIDFLAFR